MDTRPENPSPDEGRNEQHDDGHSPAPTPPTVFVDVRSDEPLLSRVREQMREPLYRRPSLWVAVGVLAAFGIAVISYAMYLRWNRPLWNEEIDKQLVTLFENARLDPESRFTLFNAANSDLPQLEEWQDVAEYEVRPPRGFAKLESDSSWEATWELRDDQKQRVAELWIRSYRALYRVDPTGQRKTTRLADSSLHTDLYHWKCRTSEVEDAQVGNRGLFPAVRTLFSCKANLDDDNANDATEKTGESWQAFKLDVRVGSNGVRAWGRARGPDADRLRRLMLSSACTLRVKMRDEERHSQQAGQ